MTPLIDVVFQLLIFLMVSSQFTKVDQRVELPTGPVESSKVNPEMESLTLVIDEKSVITLEDEEVDEEKLGEVIRASIARTGITAMDIRVDQKADSGVLIKAMETARESGVLELGYHKKDVSGQ